MYYERKLHNCGGAYNLDVLSELFICIKNSPKSRSTCDRTRTNSHITVDQQLVLFAESSERQWGETHSVTAFAHLQMYH
jgi:hypothetical protein